MQNLIHYKNWWSSYAGFIQLLTTLLRKQGRYIWKKCIGFLNAHSNVFVETLKLLHYTMDYDALELVLSYLHLILALMPWKYEFKSDHLVLYSNFKVIFHIKY